MEPRIQYAKTSDGVNIAYAVFGEGPAIVFPSGVWGNLHMYMRGIRRWAALSALDQLVSLGWSVVTYDMRGTGSSDRQPTPFDYSLQAQVRELEAVVNRLSLDSFALCGVVVAGPASITYAVQTPDRVSRLVLYDAGASDADYVNAMPSYRMTRTSGPITDDEWQYVTNAMAATQTGFRDSERAAELAEAFRASTTRDEYVARRMASEQWDVRELLPTLSVPTLVLHDPSLGDLYRVFVRRLAAAVPNSQYVETRDVASAIDEFLREGSLVPAPTRAKRSGKTKPSEVRTILFTDLVRHTEMMQRLGDEQGREVLREHERITREVLKANGGTEVKTMGDGFLASFGSVVKAVECAIALQRAFADRNASGVEPLDIRVGLNAGEPIEEDGDLFGSTVILASRIAARAEGGEILVADVVQGLCSGKPFGFSYRGEQALRGFEEPVRLYGVRWQE
jgi:class 3 adenylate cyclase